MEKTHTLNHFKAKIIRLYSKRVQSITIDTHEATLFQGENPILSISYTCGNGVIRVYLRYRQGQCNTDEH